MGDSQQTGTGPRAEAGAAAPRASGVSGGGATPATGRRERKKAATRRALADAALRLFLERGYDQVSVKDVAEEADVSTTTLFKHFPGKEALVFDRDSEVEAVLVSGVRDRAPGQSVLDALRTQMLRTTLPFPEKGVDAGRFLELVENTPALREYGRRMWMRHETALASAVAEEAGLPEGDPLCAALARFALQSRDLGRDAGTGAGPAPAVEAAFDLLAHGWDGARARAGVREG
ncbi:TetR/AcrR family transcriptional regulator [Streptomyces sp. NPDC007088]|uniref:TetR/AcrR family transcriptional regulator n=1 Tax=Streptomyces sp. NPDC007088 TaxID=3364773 RepID=UPI0036CCB25C